MKTKTGIRGFTLVEVIVVSVVVAILAIVATQVYRGYIAEVRQNVVENVAASAAGFLLGATNMEFDVTSLDNTLTELKEWTIIMPNSQVSSSFVCPRGMTLTKVDATKLVSATLLPNVISDWYSYDQQQ